jgi:hypothetical protein
MKISSNGQIKFEKFFSPIVSKINSKQCQTYSMTYRPMFGLSRLNVQMVTPRYDVIILLSIEQFHNLEEVPDNEN